jgi:glycosyltransferase involved in cell wall biosynthesis
VRVLAIVPAFQEEDAIAQVVVELRKAQPALDVVVIDDCSRDATGSRAREAGARVLTLPVNLGIGGAVQTGFKYAVARGYDAVVQVDGDGQHDPAQLGRILQPLREHAAQVVIGSRFLDDTGYRASPVRRLGMRLFGAVVRAATGQRITDTTSGFRALDRQAFSFLARNYPVDFPDAETLVLLRRAGFELLEVSVRMRPRVSGRSSTTPLRALYYPFKQLLSIGVVLMRKPPESQEAPWNR